MERKWVFPSLIPGCESWLKKAVSPGHFLSPGFLSCEAEIITSTCWAETKHLQLPSTELGGSVVAARLGWLSPCDLALPAFVPCPQVHRCFWRAGTVLYCSSSPRSGALAHVLYFPGAGKQTMERYNQSFPDSIEWEFAIL